MKLVISAGLTIPAPCIYSIYSSGPIILYDYSLTYIYIRILMCDSCHLLTPPALTSGVIIAMLSGTLPTLYTSLLYLYKEKLPIIIYVI